MAADFWTSRHCKQWIFNNREIELRNEKQCAEFPKDQRDKVERYVHAYFILFIKKVCLLQKLDRQVAATASVLFHRYYTQRTLLQTDPRLIALTIVWIASKTCEEKVKPEKLIQTVRKLDPDYIYNEDDLVESEIETLGVLDCDVTVFLPYYPMVQYLAEGGKLLIFGECYNVIQDSFYSDIWLRYPPYLIAVAAIYTVCVFCQIDCTDVLKSAKTYIENVQEAASHIRKMYKRKVHKVQMRYVYASLQAIKEHYSKNKTKNVTFDTSG